MSERKAKALAFPVALALITLAIAARTFAKAPVPKPTPLPKATTWTAAQIQSMLTKTLDAYAAAGKFIGPPGPQGPQGPAGATVSTYPANPSANSNGGSIAGFSQLSAANLTVDQTTTTKSLNVSGNATVVGGITAGSLSTAGTINATNYLQNGVPLAQGASPAGSAGCVQLYATSTTFGCSTNLTYGDAAGLFIGPKSAATTAISGSELSLVGPDFGNALGLFYASAGVDNEIDFISSSGTSASAPAASLAGNRLALLAGVGYTTAPAQNLAVWQVYNVFADATSDRVPGQYQLLVTGINDPDGEIYHQALGNGFSHIGPQDYGTEADVDSTLTIEDSKYNKVTTHIIREGPLQGTTDLTQWQDASKNVLTRVTSAGALQTQPSGAQPTCDASKRFTFWTIAGGSGVKDSVQVCAKDAGNVYAWRTIY